MYDQKRNGKNKIVDIAIHQTGILTTNAQAENKYFIIVNGKDILQKPVNLHIQNDRKIEENAEPEENEACETDKLINIVTEIKHVNDERNHITMTVKFNKTEEQMWTRDLRFQ